MSEVDLSRIEWRKSRRSTNGGNCVEVAATHRMFAVRDSKNPEGGHLDLTSSEFAAMLAAVKAGAFDLR